MSQIIINNRVCDPLVNRSTIPRTVGTVMIKVDPSDVDLAEYVIRELSADYFCVRLIYGPRTEGIIDAIQRSPHQRFDVDLDVGGDPTSILEVSGIPNIVEFGFRGDPGLWNVRPLFSPGMVDLHIPVEMLADDGVCEAVATHRSIQCIYIKGDVDGEMVGRVASLLQELDEIEAIYISLVRTTDIAAILGVISPTIQFISMGIEEPDREEIIDAFSRVPHGFPALKFIRVGGDVPVVGMSDLSLMRKLH